jgi:chaperone modulatory protein CbpM
VVQRVEEGYLSASGTGVLHWRFTAAALRRARRLRALERDFDAAPELAALVADLLEEIERLRAREG